MLTEIMRAAADRGFQSDVFGKMTLEELSDLASRYVFRKSEDLTVLDPELLRCLYGDRYVEKGLWLYGHKLRGTGDPIVSLHLDRPDWIIPTVS